MPASPSTPIPFDDFGGNGPVLHLAHANGFPPGSYRQLAGHLAGHFHVLGMLDRPLWPGSRPEALSSWEVMGQDLVRFLEQQGLKGVIGVGHSLGGVVTIYAARQRPELFRALVLIEPVVLPPAYLAALAQQPELAQQNPLVRTALRRRQRWPSLQAAFDHFRPKSVFRQLSDEALWDYVHCGLGPDGNGQVALRFSPRWEAQIYSHAPTDVWHWLPALALPTLAIRAEHSNTLFPDAWRQWQAVQPAAHFVELPGTDHLLPLAHPARVAQAILEFCPGSAGP